MVPGGTYYLVLFGKILKSTVGERFTHKELAMIRLAPYPRNVIIGLILSDGWLIFGSRSKNARLEFKQSLDHISYVFFIFNILSHYCSSSPNLTTGIKAGNRFMVYNFFTRSMPCMTKLHSLFYPNGVKIIT